MKIEIDRLPPSVNHMYGRSKVGSTYLTKDAKKFKEELGWIAKTKKKDYGTNDIKVDIVFKIKDHRRRDIDNLLKATFDSLKGIIFDDDCQIIRATATKMIGHYNRTIIEINNMDYYE